MLKVTPEDELIVHGPFSCSRRATFSLTNDLPKDQVFKIKSTAPERIGVSPNSGFIRAYDRVEVLVTLAGNRPSDDDPMIRNKEKFLIQSAVTNVPCSVWASTNPKELLRNVQVSLVKDVRLSVRFLPGPASPSVEVDPTPEIVSKIGNGYNEMKQPGDKNGFLHDESSSSSPMLLQPKKHVKEVTSAALLLPPQPQQVEWQPSTDVTTTRLTAVTEKMETTLSIMPEMASQTWIKALIDRVTALEKAEAPLDGCQTTIKMLEGRMDVLEKATLSVSKATTTAVSHYETLKESFNVTEKNDKAEMKALHDRLTSLENIGTELAERVTTIENTAAAVAAQDMTSCTIKELKDRVTALEALLVPQRVMGHINSLPVDERNPHLERVLLVAAGATVALTVAKTVKF